MPPRITEFPQVPTQWTPSSTKAKIRGGALATQASRDAAFSSQQYVIPHGRRVVSAVGLNGATAFLVVDGTDPGDQNIAGTLTQVYPLSTSERIMDRGSVHLTPGYRLAIRAVFCRSGPVQFPGEGAAEWFEDRPVAKLNVTVTFNKGMSVAVQSYDFIPPFSEKDFKALTSTGQGGAWKDLVVMDHIVPSSWTENVTASWVVTAFGGIRPVDVCIYERPFYAYHDVDQREGTCPSYPNSVSQEYAITGKDFGDEATLGSVQSNKSARDQQRVWGPRIFEWSSWHESAGITATEAAATTLTSTSWVDLFESSVVYHDPSRPGWSMSSGGYGRTLEQSGDLELRGKVGVLPVKIRLYAKMGSAGPTGSVRFTSSGASVCDIAVSGTSYDWYTSYAVMRVPVHATVAGTMQILAKVTSSTLSVRYCSVEHWANYEVEE